MVRQIDFSGFAGEGGTAGRHLGAVAVPIVSIDRRGVRHPVGRRIDARRDQSTADVSRVIDRRRRVHHHHPASKFLVSRTRTATVPQADGDARAIERIRGNPQQIGPRGNGGVDIIRREIKRTIPLEIGELLDATIRRNHAQRQAQQGRTRPSVLAAGVLVSLHPRDHPRPVRRPRELSRGIG